MYIQRASIRNIRSISELEWSPDTGMEPGWHVVLGDNGSGKSSFLRSLRPKNLYPEHVFVWENYLYACGTCNGPKRNHFMVFAADGSAVDVTWKPGQPVTPPAAGEPLLLHPRKENPLDFMMLDLRDTFEFVPTAARNSREFERAKYTIELLRLNLRDDQKVARREAYGNYRARLAEFIHRRDSGVARKRLDLLIAAMGRIADPTVW